MGNGESKMKKKLISKAIATNNFEKKILHDEESNITTEMTPVLLYCDEIDFNDNYYQKLTQKDVGLILSQCGMNFNKLTINEKCNSTIMSAVKKYCRNLKKFECTFNDINEDDFIDAFIHMKKLKCLIVKSSSLFSKKREEPVDIDKILSSVHDGINELLFLKDNSMIQSDKCLHIFPQTLGRFKNLGHLSLKEYDINDESIMVISSIKSLIILCFDSCTIKKDTYFILDLPNLKYLTLNSMKNIDDCIINLPYYQSRNLKYLNINFCKNVSADALINISNLINLEQIYFGQCHRLNGDAIVNIINGCHKINTLSIAYCEKISSKALVKLSLLKNIKILDIREIQNINDDAIIEIINNCDKITDLHLQSSRQVSTFAFKKLSKLKNLQVLELVDIENVNDDIFMNMFKLKTLICIWCFNVTDNGFMRLIKDASNLENMIICRTGVTSKTLVYAADEMKKRTNKIVMKITTDQRVHQNYLDLNHESEQFINVTNCNMCCKYC